MSKTLKDIDRRARETRNHIARAVITLALRQPIDTVTVQQVVREAGISRSTFYAHYTSLADYFVRSYAWLMDRGVHVSAADPGGDLHVLPVRMILDHMSRASAYVAATLDSAYRPLMMAAGEERLRVVAEANLRRLRPKLAEEERQAIATFLAGGFMGMLRYWQTGGMRESPESLQARFEALAARLSASDERA